MVAAMKFEASDGTYFSMKVARYEFPDEELGPTEDNPASDFQTGRFLIVDCSFHRGGREWSPSAAIMTTDELERLMEWLQSLKDGKPAPTGFYFTERDLEFSIDESRAKLHIHISGSFLPVWHKGGDTLTIEFPMSEVDLDAEIKAINQELRAFPGRPPLRG
jgi:hypothetical protein